MKFRFRLWLVPVLVLILQVASKGQGYFQQQVNYDIDVQLDDKAHILRGKISFEYHNHSPDTLNELYVHLWPNGYRDRNTPLAKQLKSYGRTGLFFSKPEQRGFIDSLQFTIDNFPVTVNKDSLNTDIVRIPLAVPLFPGKSLKVSTPFRVKIPDASFSRLGHSGQQYLITQWYPKPAVYDQYGWHAMPYLDLGEFYSEFGNYTVKITLPDNYQVAATGKLQDAMELSRLYMLTAGVSFEADSMSFPKSSKTFKTLTYKQDSVHDFAFFADKRYRVQIDTLQLEGNPQVITCFLYFTPETAPYWKRGMQYLKASMRFYSEKIGTYPFSTVTAVDGLYNNGCDMEYPTITVLSAPDNDFMLEDLFVHEIGHNWFYGILGNNERAFPWMDEGVNSAYELWYCEQPINTEKANDIWGMSGFNKWMLKTDDLDMLEGFQLKNRAAYAKNSYQSSGLAAPLYTRKNYTANVYDKTAIVFNYLRAYLGDSLYSSCMQTYYQEWAFKHPYPQDMQAVFERISGEKLSWFFDTLLASGTKIDAQIKGRKNEIVIEDCADSGVPMPVTIESDTSSNTIFVKTDTTLVATPQNMIRLDHRYFPDVQPYSNTLHPKLSGTKIKIWPPVSIETGQKIYSVMPVPAYNTANEMMAGIAISNIQLIPKETEFTVTPLYDFSHKTVSGAFTIAHKVYFNEPRKNILTLNVSGKRFGYINDYSASQDPADFYELLNYNKLEPKVQLQWNPLDPLSKALQLISLRSSMIWKEEIQYDVSGIAPMPYLQTYQPVFNELQYQYLNNRAVDPFSFAATIESGPKHLKSSLEAVYTITYGKNKKGVRTRLFGGYFIDNTETARNYNFKMSGWEGSDDYKYDYYYFDRTNEPNDKFKQFLIRDGGFVMPTAVGQSNDWLVALNIHADVPAGIPIKFFLDVGTYSGIKKTFSDLDNEYMYDGGICLTLGYDLFEIYFPLFYSEDIKKYVDANDISKGETIRVVLNLNNLSLSRFRDKILKQL